MKFGSVPLGQACGAILAHSVAVTDGRLRKGLVLEPAHINRLAQSGYDAVTVARLQPGDLHEDAAAGQLAHGLVGQGDIALSEPFTGRVNLIARSPGVVRLDVERLVAANMVDPMISLATVPDYQQMRAGGMIATVKIISYAVAGDILEHVVAKARAAVRLMPVMRKTASLIISNVPGGPGEKGADAVRARLEALGIELRETHHVAHECREMSAAIAGSEADLILVLTASATSDVNDTAPEALRLAGGVVERFGMPVDPGNLLFWGHIHARPVIGLPGCARSVALNGADWVLSRIACGIELTHEDFARMGVGGLLKEIPTRPQPRRSREKRSEIVSRDT